MANTALRFKDMVFEKVEQYAPENEAADKNGMVSWWIGKTPDGKEVVAGDNKKKCISAARAYVHRFNEAAEAEVEAEIAEQQICEENAEEQPEAIEAVEPEVDSSEEITEEETAVAEENTDAVEEPVEETTEDPEINAWLLGYIPKKKQPAILMLRKDDEGYWCRIGNGFIVETGKGEYDDIIHEAKWKEFLKSLRSVVKAA